MRRDDLDYKDDDYNKDVDDYNTAVDDYNKRLQDSLITIEHLIRQLTGDCRHRDEELKRIIINLGKEKADATRP